MKPSVLIVTTARWFPTARLAVALANAGFTVDAVCPSNHPITKTDAVRRIYNYDGLDALSSVSDALVAAKPDVLVPGDDLVVVGTSDSLAQLMAALATGLELPST